MSTRVAVIVPAHNEANDIESTLLSLIGQSLPPDRIIVACDNCTDDTAELAGEIAHLASLHDGPVIDVIHTCGNTARKAGALNTGITFLADGATLAEAAEYVLTMDGDTELDREFISHAVSIMDRRLELGGLSAACLGKDGIGDTPWQRLVMLFQRIEYGRFVAARVRTNVHTMSGAGGFYRTRALDELVVRNGHVFDVTSNVEDYVTTLDLKEAGWKVTTNQLCTARTDLMPTVRRLIGQRERWVRGTVDVLRQRGWTRHTAPSILVLIMGVLGIAYMATWGSITVESMLHFGPHIGSWYWLLLAFWSAYQAYAVRHMGWRIILVEAALIPELIFGLLRNYWLVTSIVRSYAASLRRPAALAWKG